MLENNRTLLAPHRMNILGRKRYSVETNAVDYENFHFDDIWKAIARLWRAVVALAVVEFLRKMNDCKA